MKRQAPKKVSAATEAALKEVKERAKSAPKKVAAPRTTGAAIPKNQKSATSQSNGNVGR